MSRAIVTVAVGNRVSRSNEAHLFNKSFSVNLPRFEHEFAHYSPNTKIVVFRELPEGCPTQLEVPYVFKAYAINEMIKQGFTSVLWADSSVYPVRAVEPLWQLIEQQGYWFSGTMDGATVGQWTVNSALATLGIGREESFGIPMLSATTFGLNLSSEIGQKFFTEYWRLAQEKTAFIGPWVICHADSGDSRVYGHRADQSVSSALAHRFDMRLTPQPHWFVHYSGGVGNETILTVER